MNGNPSTFKESPCALKDHPHEFRTVGLRLMDAIMHQELACKGRVIKVGQAVVDHQSQALYYGPKSLHRRLLT